jgi:hypothetical protein
VTGGSLSFSPATYLPAGTIGNGGYAYAYSDGTGGGAGTSTSCVDSSAFCGTVKTGATSSTTWGGGIGVELNQPVNSTAVTFAVVGFGIQYSLSMPAFPSAGMHIVIDHAGVDYCAILSGTAGTVPWSSLNTKCWNPTTGTTLTGPPQDATHVNFQVNAGAAPTTVSFCVTSLAFVCKPPAGTCAINGDCCQTGTAVGTLGAVCLSNDNVCHAACTTSSECTGGCCLQLQGVSYGACDVAQAGGTCL